MCAIPLAPPPLKTRPTDCPVGNVPAAATESGRATCACAPAKNNAAITAASILLTLIKIANMDAPWRIPTY